MIKATGTFQQLPGLGPFASQEAQKLLSKGQYRGRKPGPSGIFDEQKEFPPTLFSEMYHQGQIPARVDLNVKPGEKVGNAERRKVCWKTPLHELDVSKFLPVFAVGVREKQEPQ